MTNELTQLQKDFLELVKLLPKIPDPPAPAGKEGWLYKDIPWTIEHYWNELINNIIGSENVHIMACTARNFKDNPSMFIRGQVFISPLGMERLKERNSQNKRQETQEG